MSGRAQGMDRMHRDEQTHDQHQDHDDRGEDQGDPDDLPEHRVREHAAEVAECVRARLAQLLALERSQDALDDRVEDEHALERQDGDDQ